MKNHPPSRFGLLLVLTIFAGLLPNIRSEAQDLPRAALQLPPLPQLAANPLPSRPAGLPGGPAPTYVPISHLTLPEKPALPSPSASSYQENDPSAAAYHPTGSPPLDPDSQAIPDDLIQSPAAPSLAGLLPALGSPPDLIPDLLPIPEDPSAPGIIEIQPAPTEPTEVYTPEIAPSVDSVNSPVSPTDLAPAPDPSLEPANPSARGPIFRVKGSAAVAHTRLLGYRFTPAQGMGQRDGIHTVASQVPNLLTSEVHGPRMMQLRPSPLWTTPYIENTFYMFCDPAYSAVRLQPGWKIRGIQIKGPHWQWVVCPKSGANTASFSIRVRAWKTVDTPTQGTVVTLEGLTLEGPPGATDWKAAFPTLLRATALAAKR